MISEYDLGLCEIDGWDEDMPWTLWRNASDNISDAVMDRMGGAEIIHELIDSKIRNKMHELDDRELRI